MGRVRVPLRITNPDNPELTALIPDATIDTGATSTCVTASLADDLALRTRGSASARTEGVTTLEDMGFIVDPRGERLVPTELLLL
jgi:hypothetical protein